MRPLQFLHPDAKAPPLYHVYATCRMPQGKQGWARTHSSPTGSLVADFAIPPGSSLLCAHTTGPDRVPLNAQTARSSLDNGGEWLERAWTLMRSIKSIRCSRARQGEGTNVPRNSFTEWPVVVGWVLGPPSLLSRCPAHSFVGQRCSDS